METTAPSGLVDIDATAFADAFARKSVAVRYSLADDPLFTIDAQQAREYADLIDECLDEAKAAVVRSLTKLPIRPRA